MNSIKLFVLPFACASVNFCLKWKQPLLPEIEVVPLELPGRGSRSKERPLTVLDDAVEDLLEKLYRESGSEPFALFGHSMGSLLAFELLQGMQKKKLPLPVRAFLSGRVPPHRFEEEKHEAWKRGKKKQYLMTDDEFVQVLIDVGGTPQEVLENQDLLKMFLPACRADSDMIEKYFLPEGREPLNVPLVILSGTNDPLANYKDMGDWKSYTTSSCEFVNHDGEHNYMIENTEYTLRFFREQLALFTRA